jgi:hypothetical protein
MTARILDAHTTDWLADETARIARAEARARHRAALVSSWLQLVIETHRGEASVVLREGAPIVPIIGRGERVRTAADLKFMAPRRQHGTDDPDHFRHVLHGEGDQ